MGKTTKIIAGVIVVIIAVLAGYVLFFEKAQAPEVVWQTYTDTASGVSLQAPAGLAVSTSTSGLSLNFATTTPYVHTHLLHELRIDIATPDVDCISTQSGLISTTTTKVINGVNFERGSWGEAAAGNLYEGIDYTTIRNNLCYRIGLFTHSANGEGLYGGTPEQIKKIDALQAADIKDLFALFDQIATTIRFTK